MPTSNPTAPADNITAADIIIIKWLLLLLPLLYTGLTAPGCSDEAAAAPLAPFLYLCDCVSLYLCVNRSICTNCCVILLQLLLRSQSGPCACVITAAAAKTRAGL